MRRHRTTILAVFTLFKLAYRLSAKHLGVVGISIKVSGKISVTGNSRKRRLRLKLGTAGVYNLTTRASTAFGIVRTPTGCLGVKFGVFYSVLMLHPTILASMLRPITV
jgi:ribosomal protein S3